jgi:hypothetical protein
MMTKLSEIATTDLLCELSARTLNDSKAVIPLSLLRLVTVMGSMLNTRQKFVLAGALRDQADKLERLERVHVP